MQARDWLALVPFLAYKAFLVGAAVWLAQLTVAALWLEADSLSIVTSSIAGECLLGCTLYVLVVEVVGEHLLTRHWDPAIRALNATLLPGWRWLSRRRRPRLRFRRK
jgi:hypothetical protein